MKSLAELFRFGLSGVLSITLNLALASFFHEILTIRPEVAVAISLATVFIVNFFVCRHFVFGAGQKSAFVQMSFFLMFSLAFRGLEYVGFFVLYRQFRIFYLLAVVTASAVSFVIKFVCYRHIVFRHES